MPHISGGKRGSPGERNTRDLNVTHIHWSTFFLASFAAQAVQNDPDLLIRRMTFAGCPADVLYEPLGRRFRVLGFLSSPLLDGYDEPEILPSSSR